LQHLNSSRPTFKEEWQPCGKLYRACGSGDVLADRHTDVLTTILRNRSRGPRTKCSKTLYEGRSNRYLHASSSK